MIRPFPKLWSVLSRPRLTVPALALVLLGVGAGSAFLWSRSHLQAARAALQRHDLEEARDHLARCLRVRFRSSAVRLLAAQTARRLDDCDEAEQHLQACERLGGMAEAVTLERVLLVAQQGDLPDMEGLRQARTGSGQPEAVLVLEALAKGYANRFWHEDALACLNALLERQPLHPQAWLLRARVRQSLAHGSGEREQAVLNDYARAVRLRPSFAARLGLAGALYRAGRPWDGALEYEQLRQIRPAHPEVLLGLARTRFDMGEVDEARRLLDELLARHPDHRAALLERGQLALHAGQTDEAERWLRRAAAAAPPCDREPGRLLCQCLEMRRKGEEAAHLRDELRQREAQVRRVERLVLRANADPRNVSLGFETATSLMRLGREQDGVAGLFLVLEQQPRYGPAHAALADYFERTDQLRRATRHRRAANLPGVKP